MMNQVLTNAQKLSRMRSQIASACMGGASPIQLLGAVLQLMIEQGGKAGQAYAGAVEAAVNKVSIAYRIGNLNARARKLAEANQIEFSEVDYVVVRRDHDH